MQRLIKAGLRQPPPTILAVLTIQRLLRASSVFPLMSALQPVYVPWVVLTFHLSVIQAAHHQAVPVVHRQVVLAPHRQYVCCYALAEASVCVFQ